MHNTLSALLLFLGLFPLCCANAAEIEATRTNDLALRRVHLGERRLLEDEAPARDAAGEQSRSDVPWHEGEYASGNWGGFRTSLAEKGVEFSGSYIIDGSSVLAGGLRQRSVARGLLDLNFTFDPEPVLGIPGSTFFAQYFFRHGPNGANFVGDLQGYSNIDAECFDRIGELWFEQKLLDDRIRVKLGQGDANTEFAYIESSGQFIHSSAGYSPTLRCLPTYPCPALSANVFVYPSAGTYVGTGVYSEPLDSRSPLNFETAYLLGEAGVAWEGARRLGPGRVAGGMWHEVAQVERFDGSFENSATGFYAVAEQQVWKENLEEPDNPQGVSLFAQYGYADANVSAIEHHVGCGLVVIGFLPCRDDDASGIYCSLAITSPADAALHRNETCVEWFYSFQATSFIVLQPDMQWIVNPGGGEGRAEAWITTLRVTLIF
ncbi:MAG TPA: carbohydrate porin [Verrucomicrobiae bacterium]|nr:carbohydrate porin [Verrucomicrobiae bacterium]